MNNPNFTHADSPALDWSDDAPLVAVNHLDLPDTTSQHLRACNNCNKPMTQGYCINGGEEYFCTEDCLRTKYTKQEWQDMFNNGGGDCYWTQWEDNTPDILRACPQCGSTSFYLSESYTYNAEIDPDTGELGHTGNPKAGGYDGITCRQCSAEFAPNQFAII